MEIFSQIGKIVTQILLQLGANSTAYIQIVVFIVAISFLTFVVYGPYFKAADQRFQKTKGADAVAKDAANEAKNLQLIYQTKARDINNKIKDIFETEKNKALKKSSEIIAQSKLQADEAATKARANIDSQLKSAEAQVAQISSEIAQTLTEKFEKGL